MKRKNLTRSAALILVLLFGIGLAGLYAADAIPQQDDSQSAAQASQAVQPDSMPDCCKKMMKNCPMMQNGSKKNMNMDKCRKMMGSDAGTDTGHTMM